jgi:hypothetical protein
MNMFFANRFTKRTYLMNAYASKGVMKETGQAYDATHVWLMAPHKNPGGTIGLGYEAAKWGDSSNFERIKHINLMSTGPVEVEVEVEEVLQGTGDKEKKVMVIHNLRFIQPSDKGEAVAARKA